MAELCYSAEVQKALQQRLRGRMSQVPQHIVWGDVERLAEEDSSSTNEVPSGIVFKTTSPDSSTSGRHSSLSSKMQQDASLSAERRPASRLDLQAAGLQRPIAEEAPLGEEAVEPEITEPAILLIIDALRNANLWSAGSASHMVGPCKPCHFVFSSVGCANAENCNFCHVPHTDSLTKIKPKPSKKSCCKLVARAVQDYFEDNPAVYRRAVATLGSRSKLLRDLLDPLQNYQEPAVASPVVAHRVGATTGEMRSHLFRQFRDLQQNYRQEPAAPSQAVAHCVGAPVFRQRIMQSL